MLLFIVYLLYVIVVVPVAAVVAFVIYAVVIPGGYLVALARVLASRPAWLPEPRRAPKLPAGADPAVPQYFYGPAAADADQAVRLAYDSARDRWNAGARKIIGWIGVDEAMLTMPLGVGGAAGMAAGTACGALTAGAFAVIHVAVVSLSAGAVRATGTVLRTADSVMLRIKNIRMFCPVCFERVPYPGYLCPGTDTQECKRVHRDVRPGRFGIVRRRCECGTPMRTLLLFGSARMKAFCPHCDHLLEYRPGQAPEVLLPFFGAAGAGKTRLLFSMVTQLQAWDAAELLTAEFADSVTTRELAAAEDILRSGTSTSATLTTLPRAHVIRLVTGKETRILHMFDAAGERFYTVDRTRELGYLGKAKTFVLVIDPLSVDAFWERLAAERQAELAPLRSAAPSPELAYQQAHQAIEGMGGRLKEARLAVVFSKADKIDPPDGDVADWADRDLRLGNLVRSVRLQFKDSLFLCAAAVMTETGIHPSIATLLRWILADEGVTLPPEAS